MIGLFKKKEQNNKINLSNYFNWIKSLDKQKLELSNQDLDERLSQSKLVYKFLKSDKGKKLLNSICLEMKDIGFPEISSKIELDLLIEIFSPETLNQIFFNPSNGFYKANNNGAFKQTIKVNENFGYILAPKGVILIVGSSNTILPVITSIILSYICGNVTVCQLSKLNKDIIKNFIDSIPSDCSNYVHYTNLDHHMPNDEKLLKELLVEIPWNVINVWGGEEANNFYYQNIAKNSNRPKIINMEPLTGIVIIQKSFLGNNLEKVSKDLARSITEMGQQLCSSPTEGFIINDTNNDETDDVFFNKLVGYLEELYIEFSDFESSYFKLDRMLTYAQDNNSKVYNSNKYGNKISIISSDGKSVFSDINDNQHLSIHERRNFLELINTSDFECLLELIYKINSKKTHKEIKKIQTILVFGDKEFNTKVLKLAKNIGAYRVVDANYIFERHPLEALDGIHLVDEFTYQISIIGSITYNQNI